MLTTFYPFLRHIHVNIPPKIVTATMPRNVVLKLSILLNVALICYVNLRMEFNIWHSSVSLTQEDGTRIVQSLKVATDSLKKQTKAAVFLQRGDYWIEPNKVRASEEFQGNDSITLSVPADFTSLDNLPILAERWKGPISCAVYATGTDYVPTLKTILYLRHCTTPSVRKLVSFHFIYHQGHIPKELSSNTWRNIQKQSVKCSVVPQFGNNVRTYRKQKNLLFPINTARNIAREMATTHFVLPSDAELYPSDGIIPKFLKMMGDKTNVGIHSSRRKVFVLPVFELDENVTIPGNKQDLKLLLEKNLSIPFHINICKECHTIPELEKWLNSPGNTEVLMVTKRTKIPGWEPFYIGTKEEPGFDDRFTWEGRSNKRIQAYLLCLLDYEFHILNNAFLVHRPGIKQIDNTTVSSKHVYETLEKLNSTIIPEMKALYGDRKSCLV